MNRFWLGVGLLALFLALGLWSSFVMNNLQQPICEALEQAADTALAGDLEAGADLAREARDSWDSHWHGTASLADHAPMDEIDALFAQLDVYAKAGKTVDFAAYCARLSKLVRATGEAHSLTWWNLA